MSRQKCLLARTALAITVLSGCKEPVGIPNNDVHIAYDVTYCTVAATENLSGHVDHYQTDQREWYSRTNPVIRRGYTQVDGYDYPKQHGFCIFTVPSFQSPNMAPICTLFYYQRAHNGNDVDLFVNRPSMTTWPGSDELLWTSIDNNAVLIAYDDAHTTNGWWSVALDTAGNRIVDSIGENGGGTLLTGWKYYTGLTREPRSRGVRTTLRNQGSVRPTGVTGYLSSSGRTPVPARRAA